MAIKISDHVCERFIERFNPQLDAILDRTAQFEAARKALMAVIQDAKYLSDNERGVLLFSKTYNAKIIIHNRTLKTIYPVNNKAHAREKRIGVYNVR